MNDKKLRKKKDEFFKANYPSIGLSYAEKFARTGHLEHLRDYWAVADETEEVVMLHTTKKGLVDEFEVLQSLVDIEDEKDYYCYSVSHKEYIELSRKIVKANKECQACPEGENNPHVHKPVIDKGCLKRDTLKGHLCKKPGKDSLKCRKLNYEEKELGLNILESRQEHPLVVNVGEENVVMVNRTTYPVRSRVEISYKGCFAKALPGRTVHLVRVAIDDREGDFIYKIITTKTIEADFVGDFEIFGKDRIERKDQFYQVVLQSSVEGSTNCGICENILMVEQENTSSPRTLIKGYFDK